MNDEDINVGDTVIVKRTKYGRDTNNVGCSGVVVDKQSYNIARYYICKYFVSTCIEKECLVDYIVHMKGNSSHKEFFCGHDIKLKPRKLIKMKLTTRRLRTCEL